MKWSNIIYQITELHFHRWETSQRHWWSL